VLYNKDTFLSVLNAYSTVLYSITNSIIWLIDNGTQNRNIRQKFNSKNNYEINCFAYNGGSMSNCTYSNEHNIEIIDLFFKEICKIVKKLLQQEKPEFIYKLQFGKNKKYCIIELTDKNKGHIFIYFEPNEDNRENNKKIVIMYSLEKINLEIDNLSYKSNRYASSL